MSLRNDNRNMDLEHEISKNLPNGWLWTRLGEVLSFIKGKKPKDLGVKTEYRKIPYINIEAFEKGVIDQFTNNDDYPICEPDDILIVWDGARCGLVGRGVSGVIGSTLAKLVFSDINSSYLFYFLQSKYEYINKRPRGVGIPHVDPNLFWNILIPLPPLAEQKRIVGKIEELFTRLEAGVEALKKVKAQIRRYRQAVLKYAFEGKLTNSSFCHSEPQSGEGISEIATQPSVSPNDLSELPEGWRLVKLGEVAEKINPGFPYGKHNKENIGIPHLRPMNITFDGELDLTNLKYVQQVKYDPLLEGDVLFNNTNSPELLGKTTYIKKDTNWAYSNHMTRIRLKREKANPAWIAFALHYLFLTGYFKMHCTHHVNQASINVNFLSEKVFIPLPPLPEQEQIVSEIERRFSVIEQIERIVDQSLKQAERLRQSILKRAFEGKLVPQDPNDEPAEKLLERIRQEKQMKSDSKSLFIRRKNARQS